MDPQVEYGEITRWHLSNPCREVHRLILPKSLEPIRSQGRISRCAVQIAVAQIMGKGSGVFSLISELVSS
jgi:hypothetical protein